MSQGIRQNNLLSGEDWKKIYRAFTSVNFSAYDFDTIRQAMVDYVRINFPEDFNDWIESSEFVAIIDLLAYLGQSLAFRMDLNARENFIDTAERRESILRLARLLSYNPRRNFPATGLVKITQVITDEDILDSNGVNLANTPILWDDANNPDWFEQFILVMNASFVKTNPYGRPVNNGIVGQVRTHLYEFNNQNMARTSYAFSANAGGNTLPFEIVNSNFENGAAFYERSPNPEEAFHIVYRNDGNGNSSSNTGFFLMFKQGQLKYEDFELTVPVENRVIEIDTDGINDNDVWVQEVDEQGRILNDWTKVPTITGNNIIYNSINRNERDIFQVITRDRDQISLRFADGRFGNVPTGVIRCWYRQSSGTEYELRPQDISGFILNIPYMNNRGEVHNLGLQYALQYSVTNAQQRETIEQIRLRAPQVNQTYGRMVNGEDYNVYPLNTNRAIKLKAVNRTYAGHNRYFDLNDPTGKYQNTNVFAEDGIIYREFEYKYDEEPLPTSKDASEIIYDRIVPMVQAPELANFYYWYVTTNDTIHPHVGDFRVENSTTLIWRRAEKALYSSTGVFGTSLTNPVPVGGTTIGASHYITAGAIAKFRDAGWANIKSVRGDGTYVGNGASASGPGAIELDQAVATGDPLEFIIPTFRRVFIDAELEKIREQIRETNTFGLRYDVYDRAWKVITAPNLNEEAVYSTEFAGDTSLTNKDASWMIKAVYTPSSWKFTCRGLQYVFESDKDVRFFYFNGYKTVDIATAKAVKDYIRVLKVNNKPLSTEQFGKDIKFELYDSFMYEDGHIEPRRVKIKPVDSDDDGAPDNPLAFDAVVYPHRFEQPWNTTQVPSPNEDSVWDYLVFWRLYTDNDGYQYYKPMVKGSEIRRYEDTSNADWQYGDVGYSPITKKFYECLVEGQKPTTPAAAGKYVAHEGRGLVSEAEDAGLLFQWRHFAAFDHRIDPAPSNIIDMFVLTQEYYNRVTTWINSNRRAAEFPKAPTSDDLRQLFTDLNAVKMQGDEVIYHPVTFKPVFGESAREELRVKFKAIKLPTATLSDGEIKSQIIRSINDFFVIENWDFGESFYFTELATYIHQNLITEIASVVPVPMNEEAKFGNLFQIRCEPDEVFISTATVADVQIVTTYTQSNLRIGN